MPNYSVRRISVQETKPFLLEIHYAKRMPCITYAFGLFRHEQLVGVVTYGSPPNRSQRDGVAGKPYGCWVLELNRLCLLNNLKGEASRLVGASLRKLKQGDEWIILSYADVGMMGHTGIVYQATNFLYCGLTAKRTNWRVKGLEHLHSTTLPARYRDFREHGYVRLIDYIKAVHGDDFYYEERPRKHRYIYIVGGRRFKREIMAELLYPVQPYPTFFLS